MNINYEELNLIMRLLDKDESEMAKKLLQKLTEGVASCG